MRESFFNQCSFLQVMDIVNRETGLALHLRHDPVGLDNFFQKLGVRLEIILVKAVVVGGRRDAVIPDIPVVG